MGVNVTDDETALICGIRLWKHSHGGQTQAVFTDSVSAPHRRLATNHLLLNSELALQIQRGCIYVICM